MNFLTPEVRDVSLSLMAGLDCPRSLTVSILLKHGELKQLVSLRCLPRDYCSAEDYYRAVCATDFLRKLDGQIDGVDPAAAANATWLEAEKQCYETNVRLNQLHDFGLVNNEPAHAAFFDFFERLRKNMIELIGNEPPANFSGRFGPGATISDIYGQTTVLHKMSSTPTFTPSALFYLVPWSGTKWGSACADRWDEPSCVRGNHYFTVPKTSLTLRSCAKEPSINGFYQLGLGRVIRSRLRSAGINLTDGKQIHSDLAKKLRSAMNLLQ